MTPKHPGALRVCFRVESAVYIRPYNMQLSAHLGSQREESRQKLERRV